MSARAGLGLVVIAYVAAVLWFGEDAAGWLRAVGLVLAGAAALGIRTPEVRRALGRWPRRGR